MCVFSVSQSCSCMICSLCMEMLPSVFSVSLMNSVFAGSLSVLDQPEQTSMLKAGSVDSDSFQDGKLAGRTARTFRRFKQL